MTAPRSSIPTPGDSLPECGSEAATEPATDPIMDPIAAPAPHSTTDAAEDPAAASVAEPAAEPAATAEAEHPAPPVSTAAGTDTNDPPVPEVAQATLSVRRIRTVGLVGSVLLLIGSLGSGALPVYDPVSRWPLLGMLRRGAGPDFALGSVYAGLSLLALAWLYLGRAVRRGDAGTSTRDLLRVAVLWGAPLLVAAPLFSRDMYSYAAQAQLTHQGLDPYSNGPAALPGPFLDEVQRLWVDTPAPYGPVWLLMGSLVAAITGHHVLTTVMVMRLLAVAGTLLIARYLPPLARHCGVDPRTALWLALLNPLLLIHFIAGGHNDALMLGLVVAGLSVAVYARSESRMALGVVIVTLAVLIKAPAAIAVAFIAPIWAQRAREPHAWLRATAKVAAVSLVTFTLVTLASGLGVGWIRQLNTPGAVVNWLSVPTGLGMFVDDVRQTFHLTGDSQVIIESFRLVGQLVTVAAVGAIWLRSFRGNPVRLLAVALTVIVMLGPVVQPWYLLWPLVLGAVTPLPQLARTIVAGVSTFLALLITPQGATLFNERHPVFTTGLAALVTTYIALGYKHHNSSAGATGSSESAGPVAPAPGRVDPATTDTG